MISLYQGAAIMIMSLVLFENEFLNIVSISFTALILNELIMVALEITTWYDISFILYNFTADQSSYFHRHIYMVISEVVTFFLYALSLAFLPEYFGTWLPDGCAVGGTNGFLLTDLTFVISTRFAWKVAVIVAISAFPLYIIKLIRSRVAPAASSKLL